MKTNVAVAGNKKLYFVLPVFRKMELKRLLYEGFYFKLSVRLGYLLMRNGI